MKGLKIKWYLIFVLFLMNGCFAESMVLHKGKINDYTHGLGGTRINFVDGSYYTIKSPGISLYKGAYVEIYKYDDTRNGVRYYTPGEEVVYEGKIERVEARGSSMILYFKGNISYEVVDTENLLPGKYARVYRIDNNYYKAVGIYKYPWEKNK